MIWSLAGCGNSMTPPDGGTDASDARPGDTGRDAGDPDGRPDSGPADAGPERDSGPPDAGMEDEPCDTPGALETLSCGRCGSQERFCTAERVWSYGSCEGERLGGCVPGTTSMVACGDCGMRMARCDASCMYDSAGSCEEEGECTPGARTRTSAGCGVTETREVVCGDTCSYAPVGACRPDACATAGARETVDCGACGTQTRFCGADGAWSYGPCEGEGACVPGTTGDPACGMCGTQRSRCTSACRWEPLAACGGEGECAIGTTRTTTDGCPDGESRVVSCDDSCSFVTEMACAPGVPVDIMLLFDMTGSHASDVSLGARAIGDAIIDPLLAREDVFLGLSYYADFSPPSADVPFEGGAEPTDDGAALRGEFADRPMFSGGDLPESGIEALNILSGGAVHPAALPLACSTARVSGGCWRSGAQRVIVVFTDAPNHNGPNAMGTVLYAPYPSASPARAEWPDVMSAMMRDGVQLFVVYDDAGEPDGLAQHRRMLADLGQPESHLILRTGTNWAGVGADLDAAL